MKYQDNYIVGRSQVARLYQKLDQVYSSLARLDVVQDHWSISQSGGCAGGVEPLALVGNRLTAHIYPLAQPV